MRTIQRYAMYHHFVIKSSFKRLCPECLNLNGFHVREQSKCEHLGLQLGRPSRIQQGIHTYKYGV